MYVCRYVCDKECMMATLVPNPVSFYYTSNKDLLNKLSFSIKYVLMYTRTRLKPVFWCLYLHCMHFIISMQVKGLILLGNV